MLPDSLHHIRRVDTGRPDSDTFNEVHLNAGSSKSCALLANGHVDDPDRLRALQIARAGSDSLRDRSPGDPAHYDKPWSGRIFDRRILVT